MRIVLTGCNGQLGRACGPALAGAGHEVVGVDLVARPGAAHPVMVLDLRDPHAVHRAFERLGGVDAVVHLANHTSSRAAPAEQVLRENLAMNASVFVGAQQAGARRVVFSSSVQAMVGGVEIEAAPGTFVPARFPIDEAIEPRPTNSYGLSKLLSERMLDHLCAADRFGGAMSGVSLRLPYVLGPDAFEANAARTGPTDFVWGGPEAFAYIHVEDAAESVRLAAESDRIEGHELLWIAAPDPRPAETARALVARFYSAVPGAREAADRASFVDCSKAERLIGWRARRTLSEERRRLGLASA